MSQTGEKALISTQANATRKVDTRINASRRNERIALIALHNRRLSIRIEENIQDFETDEIVPAELPNGVGQVEKTKRASVQRDDVESLRLHQEGRTLQGSNDAS